MSNQPDPTRRQIPMTQEFMRKLIHLSSLWMPIAYIYSERGVMLWIVGVLVSVAFIIELLRRASPASEALVQKFLGPMLREHEREIRKAKLSGATFVLLSALICIVMLPKVIAINAFTVLIVSDSAAALIGRRFGRHRFLDKSLEGSAAFVVSAVIVTLWVGFVFETSWRYIAAGAGAAIMAAIVEAFSSGTNIDDNFTVPASFGLVMWGLLALIGGAEFLRILHV